MQNLPSFPIFMRPPAGFPHFSHQFSRIFPNNLKKDDFFSVFRSFSTMNPSKFSPLPNFGGLIHIFKRPPGLVIGHFLHSRQILILNAAKNWTKSYNFLLILETAFVQSVFCCRYVFLWSYS